MTETSTSSTETLTSTSIADVEHLPAERRDLIAVLRKQRGLFLVTVAGLTDEQARQRTTVSELTLGGLIKHVTGVQAQWADFVVDGPDPERDAIDWASIDWTNPPDYVSSFVDGFRMLEDETLSGLLEAWDALAARVEELITSVDLDEEHPLPKAPWFEAGAAWSNRRVFVHLLSEIAQHAGHADILREALDGQKSMG